MNYKMNQLGQTAIVIFSIALCVLLFYLAYCMCKRYATDPESEEIQDYIEQSSANIFKEWPLFIQMGFMRYIILNYATLFYFIQFPL